MLPKHLKRWSFFIISYALSGCSFTNPQSPEEDSTPPNIIVMMADDMGYSDIGSYGSEIQTPNLDRLAQGGIRFQSFYNAAKCCPTRAALLTGLYQHEAGMGAMVSSIKNEKQPGPYQGYLNKECVTIAEVLQQSGYKTYMSGKWHVGEREEHWPRKRGFDRYFGLISGASSYYEIIKDQPRVRQMAYDDQQWEPPVTGFYMTDAFADTASAFIQEHYEKYSKQPFFLNLTFTAPHWPLHALPEDIAKYKDRYQIGWDSLRIERYQRQLDLGIIDSSFQLSPRPETIPAWETVENKEDWALRMAVYAAMIDRMDQGIGRVLATLEKNGALENTLIFFLADNGGCAENISGRKLHNPEIPIGEKGSYVAYRESWANASNTPFRFYKSWAHEGGARTPLIAHWPKGIAAKNSIIKDQAGHIMDIMPTCLDVGKATYPSSYKGNTIKPLRGTSLMPIFQSATVERSEPLFFEFNGFRAIHKENWKLVAAKNTGWQLYNLKEDPTELNDMATNKPDKVKELETLFEAWAGEVGVRSKRKEQ